MLTTFHGADMVVTSKTDRSTKRPVMKPTCVVEYNKYMGGVDKTDMLLSSVECVRKTTKWYKKVFFHIWDMALMNSHSLYKHVTKSNISIADFQLKLIYELLEKFKPTSTSGSHRRTQDTPLRLDLARYHGPSAITGTEKVKNPLQNCVVCTRKKTRRQTRYRCDICDVSLCVVPCFTYYHTKKFYWK